MSFNGFVCKGVDEKLSVHSISEKYPIGTKLRLKDDDPGTVHEVYGYEWFADHANIIFKDGSKLNVERLDLVTEAWMNVKYDTQVKEKQMPAHAKVFWTFYNSGNQKIKLEYGAVDEAVKCQKAICMIVSRNSIYDVTVKRRQNELYLIRSEVNGRENNS